jgi:hypothetical protein
MPGYKSCNCRSIACFTTAKDNGLADENLKTSCPVSSIDRALVCESGDLGFDFKTVQVTFVVIDYEILLRSFALYLCSGMYRSDQFLA